MPYCSPEQPPPLTKTRRPSSGLASLSSSDLSCDRASVVSVTVACSIIACSEYRVHGTGVAVGVGVGVPFGVGVPVGTMVGRIVGDGVSVGLGVGVAVGVGVGLGLGQLALPCVPARKISLPVPEQPLPVTMPSGRLNQSVIVLGRLLMNGPRMNSPVSVPKALTAPGLAQWGWFAG